MSDNISWRKTLKNSHNSQIQWFVERGKPIWTRRLGPRLDPYWKLQLVVRTANMELRSESFPRTKNFFHSRVKVSQGVNKLVTNLNNNEQETSEVQFEECVLKLNANDLVCRSKAKTNPQSPEFADYSTRTMRIVNFQLWSAEESFFCSS